MLIKFIENQTNYTTYYGGGSTLTNFVHDHVLRHSLTNVTGDVIPSAQATKENTYTKAFSFAVPASISNNANMSFVAMVSREDKSVINARVVHVNQSNDFEVQ